MENGYDDAVRFHHFRHAFAVTHAAWLLVYHGNLRQGYLDDLDILGLLLSAIIHDLGHRCVAYIHICVVSKPRRQTTATCVCACVCVFSRACEPSGTTNAFEVNTASPIALL